jgi:hypothetical protein
LGGRQIV